VENLGAVLGGWTVAKATAGKCLLGLYRLLRAWVHEFQSRVTFHGVTGVLDLAIAFGIPIT
jgi:hypothetical protein